MSRAGYLAALHEAFDARRDPLDDAAVRDWLEAHPEDLPEFAAMRAALARDESLARPLRRRARWPLALPPLLAAAALLLFLRADRAPPLPPAPELPGAVLAVQAATSIRSAEAPPNPAAGAAVLASSVHSRRTPAF